MRFNYLSGVILCFAVSLMLTGCAQKPKSANASDAVQTANTMESTEAKVKFLVSEAKAFSSSKEYDEALKTAKYVLSRLDSDSAAAKKIIENAQAELEALAKEKAEELKKKLGNFGKK